MIKPVVMFCFIFLSKKVVYYLACIVESCNFAPAFESDS